MSEGLVSLLTAILIISTINNANNPKGNDYIIFLLLGIMYFSKQFNSTLVVILTLFLFFIKGKNKLILFGLSELHLKNYYFFLFLKE